MPIINPRGRPITGNSQEFQSRRFITPTPQQLGSDIGYKMGFAPSYGAIASARYEKADKKIKCYK
jgi:hypothetical protein